MRPSGTPFALVLGHPYSLRCLSPLTFGHDPEGRTEQVIEECRFACGLRPKYGDQVVIEASLRRAGLLKIGIEVRTTKPSAA